MAAKKKASKANEPTLEQAIAMIEALQAEVLALRATGPGQQPIPIGSVDVVFHELAVQTVEVNGRGEPEVVAMPGETKTLRSDSAQAWIRRGKAWPADSDDAQAFLDDKDAVKASVRAAEAELGTVEALERKRKSRERDIADNAEKRKKAAKD